jgi:hypothetical protein
MLSIQNQIFRKQKVSPAAIVAWCHANS